MLFPLPRVRSLPASHSPSHPAGLEQPWASAPWNQTLSPEWGPAVNSPPVACKALPPAPSRILQAFPRALSLGDVPRQVNARSSGPRWSAKQKQKWHMGCKPATDHTWTQRTCERPAKARLRRQRLTVPRPLARIHQEAARPTRLGPEAPRMDAGLQQLLLFNLQSDSGGSVGLTPKKVHSGGSAGPVARGTPDPELELGLAVRRMQERGRVPDGTRHLLSSEQT